MKRALTPLLVVAVLVLLCVWVARNTYWTDVEIPTLPKGEALTNPFYASQRFVEVLGVHSTWDRVLAIPPASSVMVLSAWHWNLSSGRRAAIEHWVESGGRLVVDRGLMGGSEEFEQWSGIVRARRKKEDGAGGVQMPHPCDRFREELAGVPGGSRQYWLCDFDSGSSLTTTRKVAWSLGNAEGVQAMRVDAGKGSVTVINGWPFRERGLFDGDHGWLLVTATRLRRGDDVHFLSEENHPSLLPLVWLYGRPIVVLGLVFLGLSLWRGSVRLGPLAPAPQAGRRSLAEQIRGTGQFALRHGGGEALHAACVRALDEAAERSISAYRHLTARKRAASLADLTGFDRNALSAAIHHPALRQSDELRGTIEMLEAARRAVLAHTRSAHGTS
jgi:hypothetical protein